jgi:hypothetical protein
MKSPQKKEVLDTNNKKRPEGTYQAEKNLRHFCEITSQELSGRLAAIVGELDYALATPNPTVRERSMGVALHAAQEAMSLARNLKYFAVQTRLDFAMTDLSQILLDTVELVEKEFEMKQIKFSVFAEAATYGSVDPNAIQQALLNILVDASERLKAGGTLTLMLKQHSQKIEIRCTEAPSKVPTSENPGNEIEKPEEIEPSPVHGLGMLVARALIEAHGGEIIQQTVSQGTAVMVELPFPAKNKKPTVFPYERRFRRIQVQLPVNVVFMNGQTQIHSEASVISMGGCYVRLPEAKLMRLPEVNDTISVKLFYYGNEAIEIPRARVASVAWAGSQSGIGIDFMEVGSKATRVLHAIVKTYSF